MQPSAVTSEPIAAPPVRPIEGERRFLIHGVAWSQYEQILEALRAHRLRITYQHGTIELMSPGPTHERLGSLLGRMVATLTEELDVPLVALGSVTMRRRDPESGLEADRTFYLANADRLPPLPEFNLTTIPPPDLVIEVEITSALLQNLAIFAALGVPEVWRHDGRTLRVLWLQSDRTYAESAQSRAFPFLSMPEFARQLQNLDPTNDSRWARAFRVGCVPWSCRSTGLDQTEPSRPGSVSMTTSIVAAVPPPQVAEGESRFLLHNIDWARYVQLLKLFGDDGPRVSYLNGVVELMSPGPIHEQFSDVLGTMVKILTVELNIPAKAQGSTTFQRRNRKRGLEPDQCFYLASLGVLQGKDLKTLKPFPPPDLVIEVEVTAPLLDKLAIYAGLGVPEIWRHNQDGLTVLCLGADGRYIASGASRAFPFLPLDGFRQQLAAYDPDAETTWTRAYWAWVREVVVPLYQP